MITAADYDCKYCNQTMCDYTDYTVITQKNASMNMTTHYNYHTLDFPPCNSLYLFKLIIQIHINISGIFLSWLL